MFLVLGFRCDMFFKENFREIWNVFIEGWLVEYFFFYFIIYLTLIYIDAGF